MKESSPESDTSKDFVLQPREIESIHDALAQVGDEGKIRLIVENGRLSAIEIEIHRVVTIT